MVLSEKQQSRVHDLIDKIFLSSFSFSSVDAIANTACEILDSHYFGFVLFPLNRECIAPLLVTNNPPEFLSEYNNVYQKDFIAESLIETGKEAVLRRLPDWNRGGHRDYLEPLDRVRPACDGIYIPMRTKEGLIRGYWAIARAGLHSPSFSNNDLEVFRFLAGFMDEAYDRSFLEFASLENTAYLDLDGHLLHAGENISQVFSDIFGINLEASNYEKASNCNIFLARLMMYQNHPYRHGQDRADINFHGKRFRFKFSMVDAGVTPSESQGVRSIKVVLIYDGDFHSAKLQSVIHFSRREEEVLRGIFRGHMNKEIAFNLGIDESTVKSYTHNIFEKIGFHSRTELVLGLPQKIPLDFRGQ